MEKRHFESFEVFRCLKKVDPCILSTFKRSFQKNWETEHRAHTLSTRYHTDSFNLFVPLIQSKQVTI